MMANFVSLKKTCRVFSEEGIKINKKVLELSSDEENMTKGL